MGRGGKKQGKKVLSKSESERRKRTKEASLSPSKKSMQKYTWNVQFERNENCEEGTHIGKNFDACAHLHNLFGKYRHVRNITMYPKYNGISRVKDNNGSLSHPKSCIHSTGIYFSAVLCDMCFNSLFLWIPNGKQIQLYLQTATVHCKGQQSKFG